MIEFLRYACFLGSGFIVGWIWGNISGYRKSTEHWKGFIARTFYSEEGAEQE